MPDARAPVFKDRGVFFGAPCRRYKTALGKTGTGVSRIGGGHSWSVFSLMKPASQSPAGCHERSAGLNPRYVLL